MFMKIKNKKAVSFLLTLCMLSIPNAGVYADNAEKVYPAYFYHTKNFHEEKERSVSLIYFLQNAFFLLTS